MTIGGKYAEFKAWELSFLHWYRSLDDGLTVCHLEIAHDWYKGDHKPSFEVSLVLFNLMLFEFHAYDTRHVDDENDAPAELKMPCPNCKQEVVFRINQ